MGTSAWETTVSFVYHFWESNITATHLDVLKILLLAGGHPYLRIKANLSDSKSYDPHVFRDVKVFYSTFGELNDWRESFTILELFNIPKNKPKGPVHPLKDLISEIERLTTPREIAPMCFKSGDGEGTGADIEDWTVR
jgi:hypothetical protein